VLTKREENQLLVFERKVFQTICGPKTENGVYKKMYNRKPDKEFTRPEELYSEPNSMEGEIKEDQNPGGADGVNSNSLALGVRDWTHGHTVGNRLGFF
jgi:hypothetical protein